MKNMQLATLEPAAGQFLGGFELILLLTQHLEIFLKI